MDNERYLTEKEVSELTRRAVQTLRNDRHRSRGFPYVKIGRSVRYNRGDVLRCMEAKKIKPEEL